MHIWLAQSLPEGFSPPTDKQPGLSGGVSPPVLILFPARPVWPPHSMSGWRPLTFFLLVPQQALCGQSKWEHQTLLPDTAAERVSVLWGHPEPRGWPLPPPGRSLDWLHPWWRHASWHCARPLARAKETVNMLFQLRHNHPFSSVQASVLWVEEKSIQHFWLLFAYDHQDPQTFTSVADLHLHLYPMREGPSTIAALYHQSIML